MNSDFFVSVIYQKLGLLLVVPASLRMHSTASADMLPQS